MSTQTGLPSTEPKSAPIAYALPHASSDPEELQRLDELHESIKVYLNGRLSLAPLENSQPKAILELGSGSGAWAIQAAIVFPEAEVLAVDLSQVPPRAQPSNMKFKMLNLMDPLPFPHESFDVIHARLVFVHLPNPEDVLDRVIPLLKPGGWLLIEDMDTNFRDDNGVSLGPALTKWREIYHSTMERRGVGSASILPAVKRTIGASGLFDEINVRDIILPYSGQSDDPNLNNVGLAFKITTQRATAKLAKNGVSDLTLQLFKDLQEEFDDPSYNLGVDFTFTWSRRRV